MTTEITIFRPVNEVTYDDVDLGLQDVERPKMIIQTEDRTISLTVPYAPKTGVAHTENGPMLYTLDRPGIMPIVFSGGKKSGKMSMTLFLAKRSRQEHVEAEMYKIHSLAASMRPLRVLFGGWEARCFWYIMEYKHKIIDRTRANMASQVETDIEFIIVPNADGTGGYTGGGTGGKVQGGKIIGRVTVPSGVIMSLGPMTSMSAAPVRMVADTEWILKEGETLTDVAVTVYGTTDMWAAIAALNNIPDLRTLRAGQKIRLP